MSQVCPFKEGPLNGTIAQMGTSHEVKPKRSPLGDLISAELELQMRALHAVDELERSLIVLAYDGQIKGKPPVTLSITLLRPARRGTTSQLLEKDYPDGRFTVRLLRITTDEISRPTAVITWAELGTEKMIIDEKAAVYGNDKKWHVLASGKH